MKDIQIFGLGPEMYTDEGDQAVIRAMMAVSIMADSDLTIRNRENLIKMATPVLKAVAAQYPEMDDTEPRNWISDRLDDICKTHGWTYNPWETDWC